MIRLKIAGMSCSHCSNAVSEALAQVPGVTNVVTVDLERGEARVEGTPDPAALVAAVQDAGYEAEIG